MELESRLIKNAKLNNDAIRRLIDLFIGKHSAYSTARILKINRHTSERFYKHIREAINSSIEGNHPLPEIASLSPISQADFSRKVPVVGILISKKTYVHFVIIGTVTQAQYYRSVKNNRIDKKIIYYSYPFHAVAIGKFDAFKIISGSSGERERIDSVIKKTRKLFRGYFGVNWKHYALYLKEAEWRFNFPKNEKPKIKTITKNLLALDKKMP